MAIVSFAEIGRLLRQDSSEYRLFLETEINPPCCTAVKLEEARFSNKRDKQWRVGKQVTHQYTRFSIRSCFFACIFQALRV
jgi:hypothetical protein